MAQKIPNPILKFTNPEVLMNILHNILKNLQTEPYLN